MRIGNWARPISLHPWRCWTGKSYLRKRRSTSCLELVELASVSSVLCWRGRKICWIVLLQQSTSSCDSWIHSIGGDGGPSHSGGHTSLRPGASKDSRQEQLENRSPKIWEKIMSRRSNLNLFTSSFRSHSHFFSTKRFHNKIGCH